MKAADERDMILEQIKKAMEEKGIRSIDLAAELCVNKQSLSSRLHGKTEFKLLELIEICDFLGIEIII